MTSISYSKRVLVYVYETETTNEAWVGVIDLGLQDPINSCNKTAKIQSRCWHHLSCRIKPFIRHNRSYSYYGTISILRLDGHHEQLLTGLNLKSGQLITTQPFQLADFVGSDIRSTVWLDIYDGFLLPSQIRRLLKLRRPTGQACIIASKLEKSDLEAHPIWQRQHDDGPNITSERIYHFKKTSRQTNF